MITTTATTRVEYVDPLFPQSRLLPLSHEGGVQLTVPNVPGPLRPFAATLGVPRPVDGKKHDTTATTHTHTTTSRTSRDGLVEDDTVSDTDTDD